MKVLKLSLVAALAVGSFSALSAKPLEEAIKNVDFTGELRYRFQDSRQQEVGLLERQKSSANGQQNHKIRVRLGLKADVGDGFKIFGQAEYANDTAAGYANDGSNSYSPSPGTPTNRPFNLRQAYLQYDVSDYGFSTVLGRQQLGTIWTDDFVGTAAKFFYSPTDDFTVAAFAVDSFQENIGDSDAASFNLYVEDPATAATLDQRLYKYNMYGAALLGKNIGGSGLDFGIWGAHLDRTATFYAADINYLLDMGEDLNWRLRATYMGNKINDTVVKNLGVGDGQLINVYGTLNAYGFDGTLGGIMLGKKDKISLNTIEDRGNAGLDVVGREILYSAGSWAAMSNGVSTFGYASVGYTLPSDLRIGLRAVYGGTSDTSTNSSNTALTTGYLGGGEKMEGVVDIDYKYSKNLTFFGWYSMLKVDNKVYQDDTRQTIRLQARYAF